MTELAYLAGSASAYERRFRARVVSRPPGALVLDRTFFYPTGGGQLCDLGVIRGPDGVEYPVVEVRKAGQAVLHRLGRGAQRAPPSLAVGADVDCEIDWERRHRHMRLHTAQHLLSAVLFRTAGLKTRRASMEGIGGTVELDGSWPPAVSWLAVAAEVEASLRPPREVRVVNVPRADWERDPAPRSGAVALPPNVDPIRVIEIDGIDRCPCGGTHVRSTMEVGGIALAPTMAQPGAAARVVFSLSEEPAHSGRVSP